MISTTENVAAGDTLKHIERLAKEFADARAARRALLTEVEAEINRAVKPRLKKFLTMASAEGVQQAALLAAVKAAPELFGKPKSRTLHDIKFGFRKGSGGLVWDEEDEIVLRRIHKMFPDEAANAYLHITERPNKETLEGLPATVLKKLGIEIEAAGDVPFVKAVKSDLEKFAATIVEGVAAESETK
jgi:hypothetical protein